MKNILRLMSAVALLVFITSSGFASGSAAEIEGKTFLIYTGDGAFHQEYSNFVAAFGVLNTVNNDSEADLTTDLANVDVLMLPGNQGLSAAQLTAIGDWFADGNKLLWVAGDSDFGGFFIAQDLNPVLEKVGTVLRLDAGAVDDPVSNDGASYRVVANHAGSGPIATAVTVGVTNVTAPFHGPTSVYYVDDTGAGQDLRASAPANVEALVLSSADSSVIDQDVSLTDGDFYLSQTTKGNYPLMAVEIMGDSAVVVSGEAQFADYKEMYGSTFEKSGNPHAGKELVDNMLDYYFDNVFDDSTDDGGLPFDMTFFALSLVAMTTFVFIRRRR